MTVDVHVATAVRFGFLQANVVLPANPARRRGGPGRRGVKCQTTGQIHHHHHRRRRRRRRRDREPSCRRLIPDMGNTGSSSGRPHHDDTVDYGSLSPQGVYTGPRDWNHPIVSQLIVDRKLAPFYRPLEEYSDDWDDDQILAARKDFPDSDSVISDTPAARPDPKPSPTPKRTSTLKEPSRLPEAALYRGAVECPICFLVRGLSMLPFTTDTSPVLSSQHQPLPLLRSSHLHRVLRADKEN